MATISVNESTYNITSAQDSNGNMTVYGVRSYSLGPGLCMQAEYIIWPSNKSWKSVEEMLTAIDGGHYIVSYSNYEKRA